MQINRSKIFFIIFSISIILFIYSIFVLWATFLRPVLDNIESVFYDYRVVLSLDNSSIALNKNKASKDILLVVVDNYSMNQLINYPELKAQRFPWPRRTMADVVKYINLGNPKAIVLDFLLKGAEGSSKENKLSDEIFGNMLKKYDNVFIGAALTKQNLKNNTDIKKLIKKYNLNSQQKNKLVNQNNFSYFVPIYKPFLENTNNIGVLNQKPTQDGVVRQHLPIYGLKNKNNEIYLLPSMPLAVALYSLPVKEKMPFAINKDKIIIGKRVLTLDKQGSFDINWYGPGGPDHNTYKYVSISKILLSNAYNTAIIKDMPEQDFINPKIFKDKIIIISNISAGVDTFSVPFQMNYPGPEILATCIDNILNDTIQIKQPAFIKRSGLLTNLVIMLVLCLLTGLMNIKSRYILMSIVGFISLILSFIITSILLFVNFKYSLNMAYPLLFMTLTAIGTFWYKNVIIDKQRHNLVNTFERFVSPQIIKKIVDNPGSVNTEVQKKEMTVLFSDIRGFTHLSEVIPAQDLVMQLREYFNEMVDVVLKYDGTLDKFIGDAVMAFFGDPIPQENHSLRAVLTAIEMQKRLDELNKKWKKENKQVLSIGIGINTGEMIVGHLGSKRVGNYTVFGDSVNLAARVESLTKEYQSKILITEFVYEQVKDYIDNEYLDCVKVKGKEQSVKIYRVLGIKH